MVDDEAAASLAADIKANGLVEPGWLMPDGTLLDGRNRWRACVLAGVEMRWRIYDGGDPITFVMSLNLQRRHLSAGQKAAIGLEVLPLYEAEAKARIGAAVSAANANQPKRSVSTGADLPHLKPAKERAPRARDRAAEAVGVSGKAIAQAKRVAEQAPDLFDKVKDGSLALDAAEKQTKRRVAQAEEQAAREIKVAAVTVDATGAGWRMMAGDFRDRLLELPAGCVDLIVTDPPYPAEFLPLYSDLSRIARHVLADDGICVVMTGKIALPEVIARLGEHLNYGWVYALPLPGSNTRVLGRHVVQCWKPLFAFSKGAWPSSRIDWHPDMLDPAKRAKDRYRWQQDGDPTMMLIDDLCPKNGTVLDPFCGTAAFGSAALQLGRHFIGCEIDSDRFRQATEVLNERACA
jgi:ParB-like chromosome segregation protein Spo0J